MLYAIMLNSVCLHFFFSEPHSFPCLKGKGKKKKKKRTWKKLPGQRTILKRKDHKMNTYSLALGQEID